MSSSDSRLKNRWSAYEFFRLGFSVIMTKLFYRGAKLVSYPIFMRGKKGFRYGRGLNIGYGCHFDLLNTQKVTLRIGENCEMGDWCHVVAIDEVKIGDNFLAASKVFISDCSHGEYGDGANQSDPATPPRDRELISEPVSIGDNVWVGDNVVILAGARIGNGCVIGANSVVNSSIPDNSIAVGAPARVVKIYDKENKRWIRATQSSDNGV